MTSQLERDINKIARDIEKQNDGTLCMYMAISANGSVYTCPVLPAATQHLHIHSVQGINPGNATSYIRFYEAGNTAVSAIKAMLAIPASADQQSMFSDIAVGTGKALLVGMHGTQAGQVCEALIYYHLED